MGEHVERFEAAFAQKFRTRHALIVISGSTANLVSVDVLSYKKKPSLQRGDDVIVSAISSSTTYYSLQQYGLWLRFVDDHVSDPAPQIRRFRAVVDAVAH